MRISKYLLTLLVLAFTTSGAFANPQNFVSAISSNEINIDSNFNGKTILLFGAKSSAGKLIIAIRGPQKDFLVTKKDKLFGIWHNSKRLRFKDASSYYAIFSTFDDNIISNDLLKKFNLGTDNLLFETIKNKSINNEEKINFTYELVKNLKSENLYSKGTGRINFLDETLFKIDLEFPKNISQGAYSVDLYFINEGTLESFQTIPIYVNQIGLSAKISRAAYESSFFYGILSVILALLIGWIANYVFNRFIGK